MSENVADWTGIWVPLIPKLLNTSLQNFLMLTYGNLEFGTRIFCVPPSSLEKVGIYGLLTVFDRRLLTAISNIIFCGFEH